MLTSVGHASHICAPPPLPLCFNKQRERETNVTMLGTVMPFPTDTELNLDDKG
jgi:hypothetical protein